MRCPKCRYVSFDHLEVCKRCGANLPQGKRRQEIPALTIAPPDSPPPISPLLAESSAPNPPEEIEVRVKELNALLAELSDPRGLVLTSAQAAEEKEAMVLQPEGLQPMDRSSGSVAQHAGVVTVEPGPISVGTLPKAGFWVRVAAWIADVLFLFLPTVVAAVLVWATITLGGWLGGEINDQVKIFAGISSVIIVVVGGFQYFTLFVGWRGQTPGKMIFGLKIVQVNGQEMTYGRACLRSICWGLSLLLFSLGFLMIAFNRQKRGLHDILAGTYVIRNQHRL